MGDANAVNCKIQNIVVTTRIASSLNLIELNQKLSGAIYEPGKFPALRLKRKNIGHLLYTSGKIVCTGAKSVEEANEKITELRNELAKYNVKTSTSEVFVTNIVASVNLNRDLNLQELSYQMEDSEYNPEYFPGMKITAGGTRFLVFRTGKAILPGLKDVASVEKMANWLNNKIETAELKCKTAVKRK